MMGFLVSGLKGRSLGLRLPAKIGARPHDLRKLGGKLTERATSRSFSLDESRRRIKERREKRKREKWTEEALL
jgi:hypothetical protein